MGAGGFPGEWRVGMTGAARGVCAGVLGSLLLISPAEAEAEPDAAPFPPAGRLGCWRNREKSPINNKNYFFFLKERNTLQKAAKSKSFVWMRPKKVSLCKLTAFNYCSWGFFGLTAVIQDVVSTSNMRRSTMRNVNSCIWLSYSAVEKSSLISLYFLSKDPD